MNTELKFDRRVAESVRDSHTLIAGTTGSGKSVLLNDLLILIHSQGYGRCILFDLKRVELRDYKKLEDFAIGYVSEPRQVLPALDWAIEKMESRYLSMKGRKSTSGAIFLVIDELADLLTVKGALERIVKIGRLGRAANIRLLCATQDPSRRTLSAQIMQNFTCSIALRCRSAIESRQIIGTTGAELLPRYGKGIIADADGVDEIDIPYVGDEWIDKYIELHSPAPVIDLREDHSLDRYMMLSC